MVVFLLFCGVPQKTVAAITNYTDRQVRNIRIGLRMVIFRGKGRSGGEIFGGIVKYIVDHPVPHLKM